MSGFALRVTVVVQFFVNTIKGYAQSLARVPFSSF